ncbi:OmpA family protein [bacterium]|nr:OmpA family protein [bacterium]
MKRSLICLQVVFFILMGTSFSSGEETANFGKRVPTETEIVNALTPAVPEEYKTRSIKVGSCKEIKAISMEINFDFDSALINTDSAKFLDALGRALTAEKLETYTFLIEGHTDASGSSRYNQYLSEERADSVRQYLEVNYGIRKKRLNTSGKGESDPIDQSHPLDPKNRRVKIVNIGN